MTTSVSALARRHLRAARWIGFLTALLLASTGVAITSSTAVAAAGQPARSCESLASLSLPNTTVVSAAENTTGTAVQPSFPPATGLPAFCDVQLTVTNPGFKDNINIEVWLPTSTWNGRFQGVGGSAWAARVGLASPLGTPNGVPGLKAGYAVADTDAGHPANPLDGSFALLPNGELNWPAIIDFGFLGIHEMTVTAQAVTRAYYGVRPAFSYFNGCSTGGRQALMEAQRFPNDYDGILSGAPAINWTRYVPAELWPQLVMLQANDFLPQCKFAAANAAAVAACDQLGDGVVDGVIGDVANCHFDPATLVGTETPCGTITAADAAVIAKIWQGARSTTGRFLWNGLEPGASFGFLANTVTLPSGQMDGAPFFLTTDWIRYFLLRNPGWDWHTSTFEQFDRWFQQSVTQFSWVMATDNPNLHPFAAHGGKVLIWHGLADQLIFPQGTANYYQHVQNMMGGEQRTEQVARLFLAPGVGHCGLGSAGPIPTDPFGALVNWVERQQAPSQLPAAGPNAVDGQPETRPVCIFPLVAHYRGQGNVHDAANFVCQRTSTPETD